MQRVYFSITVAIKVTTRVGKSVKMNAFLSASFGPSNRIYLISLTEKQQIIEKAKFFFEELPYPLNCIHF